MRLLASLLALFAMITPAHAHGDGLPIGPSEVWHHWNFDPWIWTPLLLAHWLYGRGVLRAWRRAGFGRIIEPWRVTAFISGEAALVLALISPIDPLGETLLSAHMVQHILLTTFAPMLLVLGAPGRAWLWAAPLTLRAMGASKWVRALVQVWRALTKPLMATMLHSLALWLWHAPFLFDAALNDENVHTLEHLSFFVTALLFWSAMFSRAAPAFAAFLILTLFMQGGMLGAILALAPSGLYDYGDQATLWGLSAVEDQQIAGLLMWAPAGLAYFAPFVWLVLRALAAQGRLPSRDSIGIMRASTSSRSMK